MNVNYEIWQRIKHLELMLGNKNIIAQVDTHSDLSTLSPSTNDVAIVKDEGKAYEYDGAAWKVVVIGSGTSTGGGSSSADSMPKLPTVDEARDFVENTHISNELEKHYITTTADNLSSGEKTSVRNALNPKQTLDLVPGHYYKWLTLPTETTAYGGFALTGWFNGNGDDLTDYGIRNTWTLQLQKDEDEWSMKMKIKTDTLPNFHYEWFNIGGTLYFHYLSTNTDHGKIWIHEAKSFDGDYLQFPLTDEGTTKPSGSDTFVDVIEILGSNMSTLFFETDAVRITNNNNVINTSINIYTNFGNYVLTLGSTIADASLVSINKTLTNPTGDGLKAHYDSSNDIWLTPPTNHGVIMEWVFNPDIKIYEKGPTSKSLTEIPLTDWIASHASSTLTAINSQIGDNKTNIAANLSYISELQPESSSRVIFKTPKQFNIAVVGEDNYRVQLNQTDYDEIQLETKFTDTDLTKLFAQGQEVIPIVGFTNDASEIKYIVPSTIEADANGVPHTDFNGHFRTYAMGNSNTDRTLLNNFDVNMKRIFGFLSVDMRLSTNQPTNPGSWTPGNLYLLGFSFAAVRPDYIGKEEVKHLIANSGSGTGTGASPIQVVGGYGDVDLLSTGKQYLVSNMVGQGDYEDGDKALVTTNDSTDPLVNGDDKFNSRATSSLNTKIDDNTRVIITHGNDIAALQAASGTNEVAIFSNPIPFAPTTATSGVYRAITDDVDYTEIEDQTGFTSAELISKLASGQEIIGIVGFTNDIKDYDYIMPSSVVANPHTNTNFNDVNYDTYAIGNNSSDRSIKNSFDVNYRLQFGKIAMDMRMSAKQPTNAGSWLPTNLYLQGFYFAPVMPDYIGKEEVKHLIAASAGSGSGSVTIDDTKIAAAEGVVI